jgi:hypothetical protein
MAKSTAAIEIEVTPKGGATETVKTFKQQLKEAKNEAQQLVATFGEFSQEALAGQQKVANLSDQMEDFNDRVKALNPDKFAKVQTVVNGVASGFSAAQGAMALFGSESQDLQKTLVKVQGAMALAQGLEGLGKVQQQFKTLATELKGNVTKSFSTVKGAMSALGIGLLIAALTYVIANFEKVKKTLSNLIPGFADFANFVGELVQGFTDWLGITSAQDRALDKLNKTTDKSNDKLEREIALLKAQGNELGAFAKEREKLNNDLIQARANMGKNNEKEWGKIIDDTKNALKILSIEEKNYITEQSDKKSAADKEAANKRKENLDKEKANALERKATLLALNQSTITDVEKATNAAFDTKVKGLKEQGYTEAQILKLRNVELDKARKEFTDKESAEQKKKEDEIKENRQKFIEAELKAVQDRYEKEINFIKIRDEKLTDQTKTNEQIKAKEQASLEEQRLTRLKYGESIIEIDKQIASQKDQIREQDLAKEKAKAEKEKEIQTAKYQAVNDSLTAIADIYSAFATQSEEDQRKAFEVSKAVSIAQAIMNTWQGVSSALAMKPENELFAGQRFVNAGLALAAGLVSVKKISDTKFQSKSTQGGSMPSQSSGGGMQQMAAPNMSSLGNGNELTQDRRVYVTEGDISRTQKRVSNNQSVSVVE